MTNRYLWQCTYDFQERFEYGIRDAISSLWYKYTVYFLY